MHCHVTVVTLHWEAQLCTFLKGAHICICSTCNTYNTSNISNTVQLNEDIILVPFYQIFFVVVATFSRGGKQDIISQLWRWQDVNIQLKWFSGNVNIICWMAGNKLQRRTSQHWQKEVEGGQRVDLDANFGKFNFPESSVDGCIKQIQSFQRTHCPSYKIYLISICKTVEDRGI